LARDEAGISLAGLSVLVVEDEYFIADDICRALRSLRAEVIGPFASAPEALRLLIEKEVTPDLAVLDINLQGESVYPIADELARRGVGFVFTTGYDPAGMPDHYRDMPRWQKPFDPEALAENLRTISNR